MTTEEHDHGAPGSSPPAVSTAAAPGPPTCADCGTVAEGRFCPQCGQKQTRLRLSLRGWLAEVVEDQFGMDGRVPRSVGLLLTRPGRLSAEWVAGRRTRYVRPFRLYLLASLLMFGSLALSQMLHERFADVTATAVDPEQVGSLAADEAFNDIAREYAPAVLFALVPVFGLLLRTAFRRAPFSYIDHLVVALHAHAAAFVLIAFTALLEPEIWIFTQPVLDRVTNVVQVLLLASIPVQIALIARAVYRASWLRAIVSTLVLTVAQLSVVGITLAVASAVGSAQTGARPEDRLQDAHGLYSEVMDEEAGADSARFAMLRARAIVAYRRLEAHQLDPHVRYHLGQLYLVGHDSAAARLTAQQGLLEAPDHLLLLALAARSAPTAAERSALLRRYLDHYEDGMADSARTEYRSHAAELSALQRDALSLGGR